MPSANQYETTYTKAISDLIALVDHPVSSSPCLLQDAIDYFRTADSNKEAVDLLRSKLAKKQQGLDNAPKRMQTLLNKEISDIQRALKEELATQEQMRLSRLERATDVCNRLLALSEGKDLAETLEKSAKFLGTVLLLSPCEGRQLQRLHQRMKPCYKALLSVRLLDALMQHKQVKNNYLNTYYNPKVRFNDEQQSDLLSMVVFPIMLVALYQDIGIQHPDAQQLLHGSDNKQDPYRVLPPDERKELLKLNYVHTLDFLEHGLGIPKYTGNSRGERDVFNQRQNQALIFTKSLMKDLLNPKVGLGEIIKIPQIYTSVVLSTKRDYQAAELPKACLLISQLADKGSIKKPIAQLFTNIVGHFPQGYGIAFIPTNELGEVLDRYEYAIVTGLCPEHPYIPECRVVTRGLTYISSGQTLPIPQHLNLYFAKTRQSLAKIDTAKLIEILSQLKHKVVDEDIENLIPQCWLPHEYFSQKKHQNLWSKAY